jgi:hypothetical protein
MLAESQGGTLFGFCVALRSGGGLRVISLGFLSFELATWFEGADAVTGDRTCLIRLRQSRLPEYSLVNSNHAGQLH